MRKYFRLFSRSTPHERYEKRVQYTERKYLMQLLFIILIGFIVYELVTWNN